MSKFQQLLDLAARVGAPQGTLKLDSVECVLRSGRRFRYQMRDYPFSADTTPEQAEALARRIAREKYLCCQWDRDHPQNDSEEDIAEQVKAFILDWVSRLQRARQANAKVAHLA